MRNKSFNSLAPRRCDCNIKLIVFKLISRVGILSTSCEIALTQVNAALMISNSWFRLWLGAVRQQFITKTKADWTKSVTIWSHQVTNINIGYQVFWYSTSLKSCTVRRSVFVIIRYRYIFPISFTIILLAPGKTYDRPCANEATLKNVGK